MTATNPTSIRHLRELAEKATPGTWIAVNGRAVMEDDDPGHNAAICVCDPYDGSGPANAAYIAAASPSVILALLSEREEMLKALEPLGEHAGLYLPEAPDSILISLTLPLGVLRRAADLLTKLKGPDHG
jgi:hypothetical protein